MAGFFIWGHWAAFYALLPDIVPYEILGTAYGLTNTIHFTGSLIAPWMTGWVKDVTASFSWGLYLAGDLLCCRRNLDPCCQTVFWFRERKDNIRNLKGSA